MVKRKGVRKSRADVVLDEIDMHLLKLLGQTKGFSFWMFKDLRSKKNLNISANALKIHIDRLKGHELIKVSNLQILGPKKMDGAYKHKTAMITEKGRALLKILQ